MTGELYVEGEAVGGHGYWNQPALTAECFVPNLFGAPGSRLFRTGDLVCRRRDGQLQYLGRKDFQIKIRGQRVELAQAEQALREHSGIERCVVMGQGDGEQARLVAYYVAAAAAELSNNQLYNWFARAITGLHGAGVLCSLREAAPVAQREAGPASIAGNGCSGL